MKKVKFDIHGMTCSSCSAHIERAVSKLKGIKKVNVNLLSNNMFVEYDERIIENNNIIKAVIDAGYNANLSDENNNKNNLSNAKLDTGNNINLMKKRLIISICFLIPLMYIAMHHMLNEYINLPILDLINNWLHGPENAINFSFTQFLLLIPILYLNKNYFIEGFKRLLKRTPNMDTLIALGSGAATVYGIFAMYMIGYGLGHGDLEIVQKYSSDIYFESAGMILTLITLGKYLETKSKGKTSEAISKLINLAPKVTTVIRNDKEIVIETENIIIDDIIIIKPGSTIPVDGVVVEGSSSVDQASITGESMPVIKEVGDAVISGTVNKTGYFKMRANKVGDDTTLSQIIKLVEEASNSKAPISKLADKVSGYFVPIVILIAILATCFWLVYGQSLEFSLSIGIAVLVISCPCALGLATPVAIMVGTGKGAENGILFKNAESLEMLHKIDTIVLDKTGTITNGKPVVTDIVTDDEKHLIQIAASLEKISEHPLAEAIIEKAKEYELDFLDVEDFFTLTGRGVGGKISDTKYLVGNYAFLKENNVNISDKNEKIENFLVNGKTTLYVSKENTLIGVIAVADTIKQTSKIAVQEMKKQGLEVVMLTGDNKAVANTIAKDLKITHVISEVLPSEKENEISKLQAKGKIVAFVGDGINDSPALTKADVGLAIGSGTDIAIESADVVLMKDNLLDVVSAISLSKAVIKNIKMNLFWAFFYNSIGIPIAAGVFYLSFGLKLNPMIGAAAMSLSSVCVVTNALQLRKFKSNINYDFKSEVKNMESKKIIIDGMQCNHCKMTVEKALGTIEGVTKVDVDLENNVAIINSNQQIDVLKLKEVISKVGFEVKEISNI